MLSNRPTAEIQIRILHVNTHRLTLSTKDDLPVDHRDNKQVIKYFDKDTKIKRRWTEDQYRWSYYFLSELLND